jgi:hypothetical protein
MQLSAGSATREDAIRTCITRGSVTTSACLLLRHPYSSTSTVRNEGKYLAIPNKRLAPSSHETNDSTCTLDNFYRVIDVSTQIVHSTDKKQLHARGFPLSCVVTLS